MSGPPEREAGTRELVPVVYEELRRVARRYFANQRPDFTLHPTELVNEACLHLLKHGREQWDSPAQFRAVAIRKIWQVIIDHLKRRHAAKRGGVRRPAPERPDDTATEAAKAAPAAPANPFTGTRRRQRLPLEVVQVEWHDRRVELLDLAEALEDLGEYHARLREVVMLHWFGGLPYAEVADVLGVSRSTTEKDFRFALAWLNRRLHEAPTDAE